jgi:hypothetical protein
MPGRCEIHWDEVTYIQLRDVPWRVLTISRQSFSFSETEADLRNQSGLFVFRHSGGNIQRAKLEARKQYENQAQVYRAD